MNEKEIKQGAESELELRSPKKHTVPEPRSKWDKRHAEPEFVPEYCPVPTDSGRWHKVEPVQDLIAVSAHELFENFKRKFKSTRQTACRCWKQLTLLGLLVFWTGCVSMYDLYWSFKTQEVIAETEQNPVGSWLISLDGGDIALFMTAKSIGTMLVIMAIPALYRYRPKWGLTCGIAVAVFQLLLLIYLNFGHLLVTPDFSVLP